MKKYFDENLIFLTILFKKNGELNSDDKSYNE